MKIVEIPVERIRPFPNQPRKYFDQDALRDLARSIESARQMVEIRVRPLAGNPKHDYELIDGQRRWHAHQLIKKPTIRAIVDEVSDEDDQFMRSVVANFARADHSAIESAQAIGRLRKHPSVTVLAKRREQDEKIAAILGRSVSWVYNLELLLKLSPEVLVLMAPERPEEKRLSHLLATLLVGFDAPLQKRLALEILDRGLTLRSARHFVDDYVMRSGARPAGTNRNLPNRRFGRFVSSLTIIGREVEGIMGMPLPVFREVILSRPYGDRESALNRIDGAMAHLRELRQALNSMLRVEIPQNGERRIANG